jgi:hypothetical protein
MLSAHEIVGYVASVLVLLTFIARDMRLLRVMAILSNIAFILYAVLDHLPPVLFLHLSLLPVNVFRLTQLRNGTVGSPTPSVIPISNLATRSRRQDSAQRAAAHGAGHLSDCLD